ncbi:hypothetical protein [Flavobacterium sp.]|uniref:hypothetical protein n=1 Tax=Flavobacterium sp. TaxID=239 RepID=UPI003F69A19F
MQHIQGISRHQLQMSSLEDKISADNSVRFIDVFVHHIDAVDNKHNLVVVTRSINILGVPNLIAKIKTWNSPYKRKAWLFAKTTYIKLFLAQIIFGTTQNTSKFSFA